MRAPSRLWPGDVVAAIGCDPEAARLLREAAVYATLTLLVDKKAQVGLVFTGDEGGTDFEGTLDPADDDECRMLRDLARQQTLRLAFLDRATGRKLGSRTVSLTPDVRNGLQALLQLGSVRGRSRALTPR